MEANKDVATIKYGPEEGTSCPIRKGAATLVAPYSGIVFKHYRSIKQKAFNSSLDEEGMWGYYSRSMFRLYLPITWQT